MKNPLEQFKELRRYVRSHAAGWSIVLAFTSLLVFIVGVFYQKHKNAVEDVMTDPWALGYLLGFLLLSLLMLNSTRAALDIQYFKYLRGRIDELIYLKNWGILIPGALAVASLAWSYYSEPWSIGAKGGSIVAALSIFTFMYQIFRDIAGVWLARSDDVFFYPNENLLEKNSYQSYPVVNAHFRNKSSKLWQLPMKIKTGNFSISSETLLRARKGVFSLIRSRGGLLFNESKIRLCTDIPENGQLDTLKNIVVQKTTYYDTLCTNDIVGYGIRNAKNGIDADASDHDDDLGESVESLFISKKNAGAEEFVALGKSKLSNHIGGSTIVIDADGYIHLTKQGRSSVIAAGKLTSTGSGSFDWSSNVNDGQNFCNLIKCEIERELCEETGLDLKSIRQTHLLGMARHRGRGAKPEFFAVTLVNDILAKVAATEFGLTDNHYKFPDPLDKDSAIAINQIKKWRLKYASICSSSLIFNLDLLTEDADFLQMLLNQIGEN